MPVFIIKILRWLRRFFIEYFFFYDCSGRYLQFNFQNLRLDLHKCENCPKMFTSFGIQEVYLSYSRISNIVSRNKRDNFLFSFSFLNNKSCIFELIFVYFFTHSLFLNFFLPSRDCKETKNGHGKVLPEFLKTVLESTIWLLIR